MPRIAVLCGTGMSSFASELHSKEGIAPGCMIAESPWGDVPLSIVKMEKGEVVIIDPVSYTHLTLPTPPYE